MSSCRALSCILFCLSIACCALAQSRGAAGGIFIVAELNCENLFDCDDDPLKDDDAFLPEGTYRWTPQRYWKKLNNIAREILSCGGTDESVTDEDSHIDLPVIPDLVGLCEVENDSVVEHLVRKSLLNNAGYEYVVTDSPDLRGVDVALLYSPLTFQLINNYSIRVAPLKDMRPTRDILYVKGRVSTSDTLHVFVVHAPSRSGGEVETRKNRLHVATILSEHIDSIRSVYNDAKIVVMGDFNDYTGDKSLLLIEKHKMNDISASAVGRYSDSRVKGTYKYDGEWRSLDHIFVSENLLMSDSGCRAVDCYVVDWGFLLEEDTSNKGVQPRRNFLATKWHNGFSDHLPLVLRMKY